MKNDKLWFRAKRYGWGWTPISWEGWLVTLLYVFLIVSRVVPLDKAQHSVSDFLINGGIWFVIYTAGLLFICYTKGERPRWRWGSKDDEVRK